MQCLLVELLCFGDLSWWVLGEFGSLKAFVLSEVVGENMKVTEVESLYELGIGLVIVGVFIIILVVFLIVLPRVQKGKVKAAGAVIIGPLPIVFGTDKKSLKTVLTLSIILTALLTISAIIYYFLFR